MRAIRYSMWAAVVLLSGALLLFKTTQNSPPDKITTSGIADIGGSFSMQSHKGQTITEQSFPNKVKLMFLGFTNCPDVCPTTLTDISSWLVALGDKANDIQPIFITADPERDTEQVLDQYVSYFDKRIIALRPTLEQLKKFASDFKVYYKKVPGEDDDYSIDHTASILLLDKQNRFFGMIDYHEDQDIAVAKLKRLLAR